MLGGGLSAQLFPQYVDGGVSGHHGNVCEKKSQTKLCGGSECVCLPVRTHWSHGALSPPGFLLTFVFLLRFCFFTWTSVPLAQWNIFVLEQSNSRGVF